MSAEGHKSKYAAKKESGRQMYGPGCCAHRITAAQIAAHRRSDRRFVKDPEPQIAWSENEGEQSWP